MPTTAVDPLMAVQAALVVTLRADSTLTALLPGGVRDEVPESEERDYLVLGDHLSLPDNDHTSFGREITQTLHIYTKARGTKRGGIIAARVNLLLDHQHDALQVAGHRVVIIRNEFEQALRDPDPEWRQTLMRFRIHTQQLEEES